MTLLNAPGDFTWMQGVQNSSMHDACRLVSRVETPGPYNQPTITYDAAPDLISCGYDPQGGKFQMGPTEVISFDSTFRLPVGTLIDERGGLILEMQGGSVVTPKSFELAKPPEYGPTAIRLYVRSVTDGKF